MARPTLAKRDDRPTDPEPARPFEKISSNVDLELLEEIRRRIKTRELGNLRQAVERGFRLIILTENGRKAPPAGA
jgi:hypothetical protein